MKAFLINLLLTPLGLCCFGGGTPRATAPQAIPEEQDASVIASRSADMRRRRAAASQTILTSGRGVTTEATTAAKQLLGQ